MDFYEFNRIPRPKPLSRVKSVEERNFQTSRYRAHPKVYLPDALDPKTWHMLHYHDLFEEEQPFKTYDLTAFGEIVNVSHYLNKSLENPSSTGIFTNRNGQPKTIKWCNSHKHFHRSKKHCDEYKKMMH